jgi:hypothetical protein
MKIEKRGKSAIIVFLLRFLHQSPLHFIFPLKILPGTKQSAQSLAGWPKQCGAPIDEFLIHLSYPPFFKHLYSKFKCILISYYLKSGQILLQNVNKILKILRILKTRNNFIQYFNAKNFL